MILHKTFDRERKNNNKWERFLYGWNILKGVASCNNDSVDRFERKNTHSFEWIMPFVLFLIWIGQFISQPQRSWTRQTIDHRCLNVISSKHWRTSHDSNNRHIVIFISILDFVLHFMIQNVSECWCNAKGNLKFRKYTA